MKEIKNIRELTADLGRVYTFFRCRWQIILQIRNEVVYLQLQTGVLHQTYFKYIERLIIHGVSLGCFYWFGVVASVCKTQ